MGRGLIIRVRVCVVKRERLITVLGVGFIGDGSWWVRFYRGQVGVSLHGGGFEISIKICYLINKQ